MSDDVTKLCDTAQAAGAAPAAAKPDPDAWKKELVGKSEKVQKAITNHHNKYNCAQSVACAFAEDLGMDEETVFWIKDIADVKSQLDIIFANVVFDSCWLFGTDHGQLLAEYVKTQSGFSSFVDSKVQSLRVQLESDLGKFDRRAG